MRPIEQVKLVVLAPAIPLGAMVGAASSGTDLSEDCRVVKVIGL